MDRKKFDQIKKCYGFVGSWAVWAEAGATPKSNIGDLGVFDVEANSDLLRILNPEIILIGLNIARGSIKYPLANFHDSRPVAMDFKIRYAVEGTKLWGAYMTDIIKDFNEKESGKMMQYLRANKEFEKENVKTFLQEIQDIGACSPTLVAFGNDSYSILKRNFDGEYPLFKLSHYSNYSSKEKYRSEVEELLKIIPNSDVH